jgi:glucose/arabinose dehydrogenase
MRVSARRPLAETIDTCAELLAMKRARFAASLIAVVTLGLCAAGCGGETSAAAPPTGSQAASSAGVRYARVRLNVPAANRLAPFTKPRSVTVPRGWRAEVWSHIPGARLETWTPEGHLLVSSPYAGIVFELTPAANRSDPPQVTKVLSGLTNPQGLAFDRLDGQEVLYVAESDQVDRYRWDGGRPAARTVVIPNLPDTHPSGDDVHRLKNVAIGADDSIYVDVASASNATPQNPRDRPPRASVLKFRADGSHMRVFATGVRNGDGLAFAPDGTLWSAINERDSIPYPFHRAYGGAADAFGRVITSYVNDHPPDEVARLTAGRNVGWPFCNPDPDVRRGRSGTRLHYANMPFDADAVTNPGGRRLNCARLAPIERGIPAHSAPLGFHFLQGSALPSPWSRGAVIGAHGSWDRTPPRAPAVLWLPWKRSKRTLGEAITIVGGFQQGGRWGRPVDALPGPDGALYVSDDTADAIYRIVPTKGF